MTEYHAAQRAIACRILTFAGWLGGTLHLPVRATLLDFLNRGEALFRLTDVSLPGSARRHPFFGLERSAVVLVAPDAPGELAGGLGGPSSSGHAVSWLLASGAIVDGTLDVTEHVRVSDHLLHHPGFLGMRGATVFSPSGAATVAEPIERVAIQACRAVGVSEEAPLPRSERPTRP